MKSSGSKTLSAFFMLVLFASIFFISCGLPKNPFIIETILVSSGTGIPIEADLSSDTIFFSINEIDDIYTTNGINIYYCYSNDSDISLSNPSNLNLIDSTAFDNPQYIEINSDIFNLYTFKLGTENTYSLPSIIINDVLLSLSGETSFNAELVATATSSDHVYLDLSLYLVTDPKNNLLPNGRLVRYSISETSGKESIILETDDFEYSDSVNITEGYYYLHIFGSYYANEPLYEIDHDNTVADATVAYLGCVKLP